MGRTFSTPTIHTVASIGYVAGEDFCDADHPRLMSYWLIAHRCLPGLCKGADSRREIRKIAADVRHERPRRSGSATASGIAAMCVRDTF